MNELPVTDVEIPVTCFHPPASEWRKQSGIGTRPNAGTTQTCVENKNAEITFGTFRGY